jgi:transcriptional regulator with XRE-family HTH domain
VAWACEIPKPHLSRIERGQRLPSIPVLLAIAKELGVEPVDVFGFELRKPRIALLDAARRGDSEAAAQLLHELKLTRSKGTEGRRLTTNTPGRAGTPPRRPERP